MKRLPLMVLIACGLFLALIAFSFWMGSAHGPQRVSYSAFEKDLADGQIKSATVTGDDIQATLKDGSVIVTTKVAPDLAGPFAAQGVEVTGYPASSGGFGWLLWLPMLLLLPFLFMRGGMGGAMGPAGAMTQSKAKVFAETEIKITFDDVAGVDEAKEELFITLLRWLIEHCRPKETRKTLLEVVPRQSRLTKGGNVWPGTRRSCTVANPARMKSPSFPRERPGRVSYCDQNGTIEWKG